MGEQNQSLEKTVTLEWDRALEAKMPLGPSPMGTPLNEVEVVDEDGGVTRHCRGEQAGCHGTGSRFSDPDLPLSALPHVLRVCF